jgi:hypothetical protein
MEKELIQLPSQCQINQVVYLQFRQGHEPITATIRAVHFYPGKVKYDLGLWLGAPSMGGDLEEETRVYNVDSIYVSPA